MARLAAHNFVSPASFRAWLDFDDDDDLAPDDGLITRLAAVTRLEVIDLRRLFGAGGLALAAPLALSHPTEIRGAACPACCRNAALAGEDHFVSAACASLWRISCPEHRVLLADLDGYQFVERGDCRHFVHQQAGIGLGLAPPSRPAELVLAFEDAMRAALDGRAPGPAWRARTAASFMASAIKLAELVLWRRSGQIPFSHEFDEHRVRGGGVLSMSVNERRTVLGVLAEQGPRNRMNVFAAVATLLARTAACNHPLAIYLRWNQRGEPGPFDYLIEHFDIAQRDVVGRRLVGWPDCIATPMRQALQKC
jgi:hypothetical protein